jgi:hypothetical protein
MLGRRSSFKERGLRPLSFSFLPLSLKERMMKRVRAIDNENEVSLII